MSEFNEIAERNHNIMFKQRIYAINKIMNRLNSQIADTLLFVETCKLDVAIITSLETLATQVFSKAHQDYLRIKQDLRTISKCNHYWIAIQIITTEDDLRRYYDFMNMSYRTLVKDLSRFCHYVESNILTMNTTMVRIVEYTKNRNARTSRFVKALFNKIFPCY